MARETKAADAAEQATETAASTALTKAIEKTELQRHEERKAIGVELQRAALRLNELGCMAASARVLDAAMRLAKLKLGRLA